MHKSVSVPQQHQRGRRGSLLKERQSLPSPPIDSDLLRLSHICVGIAVTAFIGDSIVARFLMEGKAIWEKFYGGMNAGNFGTIGDSTQMLIEKLEKDELPLQETQAIVLMIGATDLRHRLKVQVVYDQIRKIVMLLQATSKPGVKILILGILPRGDINADCNQAIQETNEMLSHIENGFTVRWLDLEDKFVEKESGKIRSELFNSDRINLSINGYQLLADCIASTFEEIQMP